MTLPKLLYALDADGRLLFATRILRMFAYGFLAIALALYLTASGLSEAETGALFTWTLIGDAFISLGITAIADRIGRRRMLIAGATLMALAGIVFALTNNALILTITAIIGVISPGGNEIGPFLPIEQASLTQITPGRQRTGLFAWYNLFGSLATAFGALISGAMAQALQSFGASQLESYRAIVIGYALIGLLLIILFGRVSSQVELPPSATAQTNAPLVGLDRSRGIVLKLSVLFALDAFAGGFVMQSLIAYWFHVRFGVEPAVLGGIFFGANVLAGLSALAAARLAAKFGLINTMVWTHIPSSVLLILVPLVSSLPLAIFVLLVRFSISQMDVPTRQSYTMAVVAPEERSAAAGVTGIARSIGAAISPSLTGLMFGAGLLGLPFFLAGGLKIIYDLLLYRSFVSIKPPEERAAQPA